MSGKKEMKSKPAQAPQGPAVDPGPKPTFPESVTIRWWSKHDLEKIKEKIEKHEPSVEEERS